MEILATTPEVSHLGLRFTGLRLGVNARGSRVSSNPFTFMSTTSQLWSRVCSSYSVRIVSVRFWWRPIANRPPLLTGSGKTPGNLEKQAESEVLLEPVND
jgi:hypothetical protein